MDKELEALREEALKVIMALPEDKQVEMWNILQYLSKRKEAAQHG